MKVIILQDYLRGGGTETQTIFIADFLIKQGFDCQILTCRPAGPQEAHARGLGIPVQSLQRRDWKVDIFAPGLIRTLKSEQPNLLLLMGKVANSYGFWIQRKLPSLAIVSTLRTGKPISRFYKSTLAISRGAVVNSQYAFDRVIKESGRSPDTTLIIRNSLARKIPENHQEIRIQTRQALGIAPDEVVLLTVAMFRPEKNHRIIPDIVEAPQWPQTARWILVGGGETLENMRERCRSLAPQVILTGWQNDPVPYFCAADIAVLPSLRESLPNFLVEAQSFGLPVVSFDIGGNRECFQEDVSGYIAADQQQMSHYLTRLIEDPKLRNAMSQAARQYAVHEFSAEQQGLRYLEFFQKIANSR